MSDEYLLSEKAKQYSEKVNVNHSTVSKMNEIIFTPTLLLGLILPSLTWLSFLVMVIFFYSLLISHF